MSSCPTIMVAMTNGRAMTQRAQGTLMKIHFSSISAKRTGSARCGYQEVTVSVCPAEINVMCRPGLLRARRLLRK
jgi:hypothetical protein